MVFLPPSALNFDQTRPLSILPSTQAKKSTSKSQRIVGGFLPPSALDPQPPTLRLATTMEINDVGVLGQWATSGTSQDTSFDVSWAIGVCFFYYFLLFITNYNIPVVHDYGNKNKRCRRVWTASDEWYNPGHVVWRVLGNWYVFFITTFYFSLLNVIIQLLHDYDNGNKWHRRMDSERRVVRPKWCVFVIITFHFSLLTTTSRYYMTTMTEISDAGGCG